MKFIKVISAFSIDLSGCVLGRGGPQHPSAVFIHRVSIFELDRQKLVSERSDVNLMKWPISTSALP